MPIRHPDVLAVRYRRRGGHVLLVTDTVSAPNRLLPANLPCQAVDRDQVELIARRVAATEQLGVRPVKAGSLFG